MTEPKPLIPVDMKGLESLAEQLLESEVPSEVKVKEPAGYIYVPEIKLYVAEETSFNGKNWFQAHEELHKQGSRMLTLPEYVIFLKHLKDNPDQRNKKVIENITAVRDPYRAEWIDADFKVINGKLNIHYMHETINGKLKPKYTQELKSYLRTNKTPGIDFDYWLNNTTILGLPPENCKDGSLYYTAPMSDNNSVAGFDADSYSARLFCYGDPSDSDASFGVRAARAKISGGKND